MKPIHLTISGWGPYKNREEIDFTPLSERGIFLITGPTGAGKTTIFDAISYALYGCVSGEMREKNSVRSHFAAPETKTFVELLMEHDGKQYQVLRNPEYLRPRKRKNGTEDFVTEKENAVLTLPDGSKTEGNREVNRRVQELLRLDYRQFKQISMIAQGEFARFLTAGSAEKTKIFREIFSTSVYDDFAAELKRKAYAAEKKVAEYHHRMDENIRTYESEDARYTELTQTQPYPYRELAALLAVLKKEQEELEKEAENVWKESDKAFQSNETRLETARQINSQFDRLTRTQEKKQQLFKQAKEIAALENRLGQAQKAAIVQEAAQRREAAQKAWRKDMAQVKQAQEALEKLKKQQKSLAVLHENESLLRRFITAAIALADAKQQQTVLEQQLEEQNRNLKQEQDSYLTAEQESTQARQRYEEAQRQVRYARVGIVAAMLQENKPCPVCGSLEHPAPAKAVLDAPDEAALEQLQKEAQKALDFCLYAHGKAQQARQLTEETKRQLTALSEKRKQLQQEVLKLQTSAQQIFKTAGLTTAEAAELEMTETAAADPAQLLIALEEALKRYSQLEAAQKTREENLVQLCSNAGLSEQEMQTQEEQLLLVQKKQGFVWEEDWQKAILPLARQQQMQQEILQYREDVAGCEQLLAALTEELAGKERMEEELLLQKQKILKQEREQKEQQYRQLLLQKKQTERTAKALQSNLKQAGEAEAEYGVVKDLDNMANGSNSKRLIFEQYVLTGYFEEILRAANLRLRGLSGGRYELFRAKEISDGRKKDNLEMEVMDYYTGRRRSVSTLSGGEAFKASLSLALGMSDVIQAQNGGIRVDTLFIDEGFGALDSQSLEQACDILIGLAGTDRLIGIISHVQQLRERIDAQIVVDRRRDGSTINVRKW